MKKKILYCIIPYFGDEYTIVYSNENQMYSQSTLRGYGELKDCGIFIPPSTPVVIFTNNEAVYATFDIGKDIMPKEENTAYSGTLENYLKALKERGVEIKKFKDI